MWPHPAYLTGLTVSEIAKYTGDRELHELEEKRLTDKIEIIATQKADEAVRDVYNELRKGGNTTYTEKCKGMLCVYETL